MRDLTKNKVIKNLRRELMTKEKTIKGLITKLKHAKVLSQESCSSIVNNFGHMTTELFKNEAKNNGRSLMFYIPRAQNFVRKYLSLPYPATPCEQSTSIECEPGILKIPLKHIADLKNDKQGDCIINLDEMSIKKNMFGPQK